MNIRYILLSAAIFVLFAHFIACGAQFYQVSMQDDIDGNKVNAESAKLNSEAGIHSPDGWDLPVQYKAGDDIRDDQIAELKAAMNLWEMATGKVLFEYQGHDRGTTGNNFPDLYSSLTDAVNGHYMDDPWSKTQKKREVLATTIWDNDASGRKVTKADIRYNSTYFTFGDAQVMQSAGAKEIVDMQSLALHELGHLLGLTHIASADDRYSVMSASLFIGEGFVTRCPSKGDVERIQKIYGCSGNACNVDMVMKEFTKKSARCSQNE